MITFLAIGLYLLARVISTVLGVAPEVYLVTGRTNKWDTFAGLLFMISVILVFWAAWGWVLHNLT